MESLQFVKAVRKPGRAIAVIGRLLVIALLVSPTMMPVNSSSAAIQEECRQATDLAITQIIDPPRVQRFTMTFYEIRFTLKGTRHIMFCDPFPGYTCTRDKFSFRPLDSSNIAEAAPDGSSCSFAWGITAANASNNIVVGYKLRFNQDSVLTNQFNPRRVRFSLTIDPNLIAVGGEMDVSAVALPDDGN